MDKNINFINRLKNIHNNKYDYSLVNYVNMKTKVKIICKKHGIFEQRPDVHLVGGGCPKCKNDNIRLNQSDVVSKFNKIHNNKYDYSLVSYVNLLTKISIICPKHGIFMMTPSNHLSGKGCSMCNGGVKLNENDIISKFNKTHNNKYDYSLVNYVNMKTKVKIICKKHGVFEQSPYTHLKGKNCIKCFNENKVDELIKIFNIKHNFKYKYDDFKIVNNKQKIDIICPEHGIFKKRIYDHLNGIGCPKCSKINKSFNKQIFIKKSNKIHNNKYDYSLVNYVNMKTKVKIICKKHGVFQQLPKDHINNKTGCPKCKLSKGEKQIEKYLLKNNIKYTIQKKFNGCKYKQELKFDFYLPHYNTCIEYDGIQHFKNVNIWNKRSTLEEIQIKDKIKNDFCEKNKINLIRIKYDETVNEKLNSFFNI
ncbi:MAG: hypothetical protein WDA02_10460 [Saccharofermentanales bacterium]